MSGTKTEIAHGTQLERDTQAIRVGLIGVNEGPIGFGQGEGSNEVPLGDIIGETGQPFPLFWGQKGAWHREVSSVIKKGVRNRV
jgi:hypothetical protein